jgi:hypothetical protein
MKKIASLILASILFTALSNTASARYISSDPIGTDGGLNTYGYTYQNPLRWDDPDGLRRRNNNNPFANQGFGNYLRPLSLQEQYHGPVLRSNQRFGSPYGKPGAPNTGTIQMLPPLNIEDLSESQWRDIFEAMGRLDDIGLKRYFWNPATDRAEADTQCGNDY